MRPNGEPEIVAGVVPAGGSILEFGSGVGRVTHPLVERGYQVVAVDESAEMLACVRGAETIRARIQDVRLDRRFDAVMLASQLVQTAGEQDRRGLLDACARHVAPGGSVLIQWLPPERHDTWHAGQGRTEGDLTIELAAVEEVSPGLFNATMRCTYGAKVWTQSFASRRLTDEELSDALAESGLRLERFLTGDRTWVLAVPTG
ncbi:class I SAM-dependent methyltransferase [Nonomuraea sp. NPDC048916]|uniref:class I SAM-dependent methyltransferase n=1 Tax=Nonomuraea sp. NPDC048916 TaxID=3154232 RepID=UPI0033DA6ACD